MPRRLFETLFRGGRAYLGVYCISFQVESQALKRLNATSRSFPVVHALPSTTEVR